MNKKGVELAMNTIIIAVIAIIVLIVLILLFTKNASIFSSSTVNCGEGVWSDWQCIPTTDKKEGDICNSAISCSKDKICCKKTGGSN